MKTIALYIKILFYIVGKVSWNILHTKMVRYFKQKPKQKKCSKLSHTLAFIIAYIDRYLYIYT